MKQQHKTSNKWTLLLIVCLIIIIVVQYRSKNVNTIGKNENGILYENGNYARVDRGSMASNSNDINCQIDINMNKYDDYMNGINSIYKNITNIHQTCVPQHKKCGWTKNDRNNLDTRNNLPLFILSIGLEGSGKIIYFILIISLTHF